MAGDASEMPRRDRKVSPWWLYVYLGACWALTMWGLAVPDFRLVALVGSVAMIVLNLVYRYALERLVDNQYDLISALERGKELDEETVRLLQIELRRYRSAFVYAKRIGDGMSPREAGLMGARDVAMPPTEDIS